MEIQYINPFYVLFSDDWGVLHLGICLDPGIVLMVNKNNTIRIVEPQNMRFLDWIIAMMTSAGGPHTHLLTIADNPVRIENRDYHQILNLDINGSVMQMRNYFDDHGRDIIGCLAYLLEDQIIRTIE